MPGPTQKNTKIIATISDRHCEPEFIRELYRNGMNVVRINTAHQGPEDTLKVIKNVREVSGNIGIIIDTKGPEVRTTDLEKDMEVKEGDIVNISGNQNLSIDGNVLFVNYVNFAVDVPTEARILIDDGDIALLVKGKKDGFLVCEVENEGFIKNRKSINVPSVHIDLPALSAKDIEYIHFSAKNDIDFIAHSFVRNSKDILAIKKILDSYESPIKVIAKIENQQGVDNIEDILDHAYGIMIARGDLAIEIPKEKIPPIQKYLIKRSIIKRRLVITATQMLHTMIENPRPTRAEVSDVANAVYDGSDAIMLSGETAYGKYPVESVKVMCDVCMEVEANKSNYLDIPDYNINSEVSAYLCKAAVKASVALKAKAIVSDTLTGKTIRNLAGFRGEVPILTVAYSQALVRKLSLFYGVYGFYIERVSSTRELFQKTFSTLVNKGRLEKDSRIVLLAGHFGKSTHATHIEINEVSELLKL